MLIVTSQETMDLSGQGSERLIASLNEIFKSLYDRFEIVQEVLIDGVSFREGYNEFLLENLNNIKRVEIKTVHADILAKEILEELRNYLPRLIRACDSISDLFYGEMKQEHWTYFSQLSEGIEWVCQSTYTLRHHLERVGTHPQLSAALTNFEAIIKEQLTQLVTELQNGDYTAIGDRIKYELPEMFQLLLNHLSSEG